MSMFQIEAIANSNGTIPVGSAEIPVTTPHNCGAAPVAVLALSLSIIALSLAMYIYAKGMTQ